MISTQQTVGKRSTNLTRDVRAIRVMLFGIGLLSKENFIKECLDLTISEPIDVLKEIISISPAANASRILEVTEGNVKQPESKIPATLKAIYAFQKEKLGYRFPDGRVDPNGRTLRKLNEYHARSLRSRNMQTTPYSVVVENDRITLKIQSGSQTAQRFFSAAKTRGYIFKNYNYNGAVKLMRKVYAHHGQTYFSPNQLTGTNSDKELIIPNKGVGHLLSLQLSDVIKKTPPTAFNLNFLLGRVDGLPGPRFLTKVIKAKSKNAFLAEDTNTSMKRMEDGKKITPPLTKKSHDDFYNFIRDMVRTRNGLWSDMPGITNVVGFRRVVDQKFKTRYNDSLAVCYREEDELGNFVPRVKIYISSTEPGNRRTDRQVVPQTCIMVPGLHFSRQPAGRTRKALVQERNSGTYTWREGDTTMNFHQGSNNFAYPGSNYSKRNDWLTQYGFDWKVKLGETSSNYDEQKLLNLNATLSEIYLILSRHGGDKRFPPYEYIRRKAKAQLAVNEGLSNGIITVRKGNQRVRINTQKAKEWAVNYWFRRRGDAERDKFTRILIELDVFTKNQVRSWGLMRKEKIVAALTDEHINRIVNRQIQYYSNIRQIDGLPGQSFEKMVAGIYTSIPQAKADLQRIQELFELLKNFPLRNINGLVRSLKTNMAINTLNQREKIYQQTKRDPRTNAPVISGSTVGAYSRGCQIIYDTETFYEFWTDLLHRAQASGQEHWYYTLIDATKWRGIDWM